MLKELGAVLLGKTNMNEVGAVMGWQASLNCLCMRHCCV